MLLELAPRLVPQAARALAVQGALVQLQPLRGQEVAAVTSAQAMKLTIFYKFGQRAVGYPAAR